MSTKGQRVWHTATRLRSISVNCSVLSFLTFVLFAGCRSNGAMESSSVRGLIVEVQPGSTARTQAFVVQSPDRLLTFRVEGDIGITPTHMLEHRSLAQPVTVTYREDRDGLVALRVDD